MYSDYDDTINSTVSLAPSVSMVTSTDLLAHLIHVWIRTNRPPVEV